LSHRDLAGFVGTALALEGGIENNAAPLVATNLTLRAMWL